MQNSCLKVVRGEKKGKFSTENTKQMRRQILQQSVSPLCSFNNNERQHCVNTEIFGFRSFYSVTPEFFAF